MRPMITGRRLSWLLAYIYFASYVTRINFAAIIGTVAEDGNIAKSTLSTVLVCMSVAYGTGQIINGYIGDKIKPQNLILVGMITSTLLNAVFPFFVGSVAAMCVVWGINGFAQAMMWPPIVKIMAATMDDATYGSGVVIVSMGSSFGTIMVYLIAPIMVGWFSWQWVLWVSAIIGGVSAFLWLLCKERVYRPDALPIPTSKETIPTRPATKFLPPAAVFPMIFIALALVFQGMLRDSVTSWMPSYLTEVYHLEQSEGILYTVSLAVFSVIAFSIAGTVYKKFFRNEVACATLFYILTCSLCGLLALFFGLNAALAVVLLTLIAGALHGVNLMLVTHVPKRFVRYGNVSTISGAVNSCVYIGSAIATYGVAKISEEMGWLATSVAWTLMAAVGTVCCLTAVAGWKAFIRKTQEQE